MRTKNVTTDYSCLVAVMVALYFLIAFSGQACAWSGDPTVNTTICTAFGSQYDPKITNDGSGGAIITWRDYRSSNADVDIYAQRINEAGVTQWDTDGEAICTASGNQHNPTIISDGSGGAIITWQDYRNGSADIYAQRINGSGFLQWTGNGVAICTASGDQDKNTITSDGSGGAIITWIDQRNGNVDIYAQRINAAGVTQWKTDGVDICTASDLQWDPTLTSDGSGGAIIAWEDSRNGNDIYAQRINAAGVTQWDPNGVLICTAISTRSNPMIISDSSGGAIITWEGMPSDIYAQRINEVGVIQWNPGGVAICTASYSQYHPKLTCDGSGGAIITWEDGRTGLDAPSDIYTQRVNGLGVPQWAGNGVAVCTASDKQLDLKLISDGSGGAIITWEDYRSDRDIYAQRINTAGVTQWDPDGVAICTAINYQYDPTLTFDGSGGAIITWWDHRNGYYSDIFAQRVDKHGRLNAVANPLFSAPPGTYTSPQTIALSCTTALATIYYTTDGSEPTQSSLVYSTPIYIAETTTIKAKAYKSGLTQSDTVTGIYTISKHMPYIPLLLLDE
jgi:hypothetical protein